MLTAGQPDCRSVLSSRHGARFAAGGHAIPGMAPVVSGAWTVPSIGGPVVVPMAVPPGLLAARFILTEADRKKVGQA